MNQRYKVEEGSDSGHCCFEYTVLDTEAPVVINAYQGLKVVCECFDKSCAGLVCDALNKADDQMKDNK